MPIHAVLFDLGDTLWHFPNFPDEPTMTAASARRLQACLDSWGLGALADPVALASCIRTRAIASTQDAEFSHGRSPDFVDVASACAHAAGLALSREQGAALWDAWNLGGRFFGRVIFPDTISTLEELRRRGFRLGAVTNRSLGGERFTEELRESGLLRFFETLAVSCDDGWLKPHPALFQRALDDLGVAAADAVMVGDNLRADVMGAQALGMVTVWKRPPGAELSPHALPNGQLAHPDYVIDAPGELLALPILQAAG